MGKILVGIVGVRFCNRIKFVLSAFDECLCWLNIIKNGVSLKMFHKRCPCDDFDYDIIARISSRSSFNYFMSY